MGGFERVAATMLVALFVVPALAGVPNRPAEAGTTNRPAEAGTTSQRFEFSGTEMAVPIRIVLYGADNATAERAARAALQRFHEPNSVMSDYDPESELRRLCDTSAEGKPVHVSGDLWRVLVRSKELSERSAGAFDITVGPLVHLWRNARRTKELPRPESIAAARAKVGYRFLRLGADKHTVELLRPQMRLDLGGIAKGYAVDEAMRVLRERGFAAAMVEAGETSAWAIPRRESPAGGSALPPRNVGRPPCQYLWLSRVGVSTSGDLWQHATIGGVRYSHHIDPHTGMALTGRMSVTVVGPDGLSTDGLSSAAAILGPEKGMKLIEDTCGVAGLMVRVVDGKEMVYESSRWKQLSKGRDGDR